MEWRLCGPSGTGNCKEANVSVKRACSTSFSGKPFSDFTPGSKCSQIRVRIPPISTLPDVIAMTISCFGITMQY
ncbi:MAG: hypothetical protein ACLR23_13585 [Clostridia bacterium]